MSEGKASKLTAAQLRRILTENNVEFPSKAKKAVLVRLYSKHIEASGIEADVENAVAAVKKETTRQRKKKALEETSPKKKGKKHSRTDEDNDDEKEIKKAKNEPLPKTSVDDDTKEAEKLTNTTKEEENIVTPVQGSSKLDEAQPKDTGVKEEPQMISPVRRSARRRISYDENEETKEDKKVEEDKVESKVEQPLVKVVNEIKEDIREELVPKNEEFIENKSTDENASELYKNVDRGLIFIFKLLLFLLPILFGIWYRDQKFQIGFCGHELPVERFESSYDQWNVLKNLDSTLERFLPECVTCPEGAVCSTHLELRCKSGYTRVHNWKSLYGLLPFPDYCVKKMKSNNLAQNMTPFSFALKVLRQKNAENSCGKTSPNDHQAAMLERELYSRVLDEYRHSVNRTAFQSEWSLLVNQLKKLPEIQAQSIVTKDGTGSVEKHLLLRSHSRSEVSYFCVLGKFICDIPIEKNTIILASSIFLATAFFEFVLQKLTEHCLKESHVVDEAVEKAISKLQETKKSEEAPYLDTIQLREYLLCDIQNLQEKNRLWQKISGKLAENKNVDTRIVELYGDVLRIWEWTD